MNKEQDYASDTDESDDDFCPEDLAGESPASEDDAQTSASNEDSDEDAKQLKDKPLKRKRTDGQIKRKHLKSKNEYKSDDENTNTFRRSVRRKDDDQKNGNGKTIEKDELLSDEDDKSRTNALWEDFLKDVNPTNTLPKVNSSKVENTQSSSDHIGKEDSKKIIDDKPNINLPRKVEDKVLVTEVVDFAGEEVSIEREIDASSIKENKATTILTSRKQPFSRIMPGAGMKRLAPIIPTSSTTGLGSVLNQLGKKKKISVLEKSQMDWKSFKQSEGIDEQLQTFNKGKDGYLERQDFLQRTDLRQFEIEKKFRQSTRRPY